MVPLWWVFSRVCGCGWWLVLGGIRKPLIVCLGALDQFFFFFFGWGCLGSGHIYWWFHVVVFKYFVDGFVGCYLMDSRVMNK